MLLVTMTATMILARPSVQERPSVQPSQSSITSRKVLHVTSIPILREFTEDLSAERYQESMYVHDDDAEAVTSIGAMAELIQASLRGDRVVSSTGN